MISELPKGRSLVRVGFRAGFQQLRPGERVLLPEEAADQQDPPSAARGLLQLAQGGRAQFPRPLLRRRRARAQGGNSVGLQLPRPILFRELESLVIK